MTSIVITIVTGIIAFIATNIDDIFILILFFSENNSRLHYLYIVVGQYLGFAVLVAISVIGTLGGYIIPSQWIGILGIFPIIIGTTKLIRVIRASKNAVAPLENVNVTLHPQVHAPDRLLSTTKIYSVALVTIANGGDNIGTYIPLFAQETALGITIIALVFFVLVGIWCLLGYYFVQHPHIAIFLRKYSPMITPFVLISLGLSILIDSGII
jgi:cadmium resistance protein CadD (predicted permease)